MGFGKEVLHEMMVGNKKRRTTNPTRQFMTDVSGIAIAKGIGKLLGLGRRRRRQRRRKKMMVRHPVPDIITLETRFLPGFEIRCLHSM